MEKGLMTKGKPLNLLIRFAIPVMLADIVQQVYAIADGVVVGRLIGVEAFAAVSAAGSFYWLLFVVVSGFSHGFGTLTAQAYGAKNLPELRRTCALSLALTVAIAVPFSAICLLAVKPALLLMQTPNEILGDTLVYISVLLYGLPFTFLNNTILSIFRAIGDGKTPLYSFICCSLLNIVLDVVLVLHTPYGVGAVAFATVFVQLLSAGFCYWYLVNRAEIRLTLGDFKPRPAVIRELLRLGAPIGLRDCISAVGGIVIQYFVNGRGALFIAGVASAKKLYSLLFIIGSGVDGAVAVFTAQNYGAGRFDRIKAGVKSARGVMFVGLLVIIPIMFVFGRNLLGLFIVDNQERTSAVLDIAVNQLRVCLVLLPALYALFLYRSAIQGMGNSFTPMLSGIMEAGIRSIGALTLPLFLGDWGIYIAEPLGWPIMAVQLYLAYKAVYKKKAGER
jgi:putative MATE family efflux protein